MARIWVFVEEDGGKPSTIGLELLAAGRGLGEVTAVYLGAGSDSAFCHTRRVTVRLPSSMPTRVIGCLRARWQPL